jgi:hypothetical protein
LTNGRRETIERILLDSAIRSERFAQDFNVCEMQVTAKQANHTEYTYDLAARSLFEKSIEHDQD